MMNIKALNVVNKSFQQYNKKWREALLLYQMLLTSFGKIKWLKMNKYVEGQTKLTYLQPKINIFLNILATFLQIYHKEYFNRFPNKKLKFHQWIEVLDGVLNHPALLRDPHDDDYWNHKIFISTKDDHVPLQYAKDWKVRRGQTQKNKIVLANFCPLLLHQNLR